MIHTLVADDINQYCEEHTTSENNILAKLTRNTFVKQQQPHMLSGHLQGQFLSMISGMIQPENILELGTFTGYSALCLASGLKPNGKLVTIDVNEELKDQCEIFFRESKYAHQIEMMIGEAKNIIPTLTTLFDLVFIDADKMNYSLYYDLVFDKVKPGGYILADNVLYSGEVIQPTISKLASAMDAYNKKILNDKRVHCMLLPLRDGIMIARKL